jgi:hypothetical protein
MVPVIAFTEHLEEHVDLRGCMDDGSELIL